MPIKTKQSLSKPQTPVHNQPAPSSRVTTLNQFLLPKTSQELFGDSNESVASVKVEPIKPRNFAEVVAKKLPPQNTSTLLSQSSNSSSVSSLNRMPIAKTPISKITNGVASPLVRNIFNNDEFNYNNNTNYIEYKSGLIQCLRVDSSHSNSNSSRVRRLRQR